MTWSEQNIIFLISLPRSGSTLLQRILASHPEIASTSESWLLLPQIYALKESVAFSEYSHTAASRAINDFTETLPGGRAKYLSNLRDFIIKTYYSASGNSTSFYLEKTPRNNLILPEIVSMFPDAKYIFLWRNPAAVVASMIESFAAGKWNIYRQEIDLYKGLQSMLDAELLDIKHRIDIRYEDLVSNPEKINSNLSSFLQIDSNCDASGFINTHLTGRMGDPTGINEYTTISTDSLEKWKATITNPLRKHWLTKYVNSVDTAKLQHIGYEKNDILANISSVPTDYKNLISDSFRMFYGMLDRNLQLSLIRRLYRVKNKRRFTIQ